MRRFPLLIVLTAVTTACSGFFNPFEGVRSILAIALIIAQLIISYDIIQSRRSVGMKVVWIAIVWLVPLLGVLAGHVEDASQRAFADLD